MGEFASCRGTGLESRHVLGMLKNHWGWMLLLTLLPAGIKADEKALLEGLSQNGVQSAFQLLRRDYIRRDDLTFEELNRAALQGLLERLDLGAELIPVNGGAPPAEPGVHQEFLAPDVVYLRPESFRSGEGELFVQALDQAVKKSAVEMILDLRAGGSGEFEEAARVLECFVPDGEVMFKMRRMGEGKGELFVSRREPLWPGRVVVLIDEDTGNAAETVAAVLESRGRALKLGTKTRGAMVRYTELSLDDHTRLRYASAEMVLPDDTSFFKRGVTPDFEVRLPAESKKRVFDGSKGSFMKPYVEDRVRPRFNEAALVHGGNPELDDYVRKSKGQKLPGDEGQLRDVVVQRALDLLQAQRFVAGSKLVWKKTSTESPSEEAQDTPAGGGSPRQKPHE